MCFFVESFPGATPNVLRQAGVSKGRTGVEGSFPARGTTGALDLGFQRHFPPLPACLSNVPSSFILCSLMVST